MLKSRRNIYVIKTTPYNDNEKLESLLNEMSIEGWDLYSMQEVEDGEDILYNCIFMKEASNDEDILENDGLIDFKPRIERIINSELDPYELCLDILKKIKEKRQKISQVKSLIDGTSENSRAILNEEISKHINELENLKKKLSKVVNPDIMEHKLGEQRLTLAISEELTEILDSGSEDNLLSQIIYIRQNLTETLGYIIPRIKIEVDESLDENEFCIKLRGIPVVNSFAYCNHTMFLENELNIDKLPEDAIKIQEDKINLDSVIWINDEIAKDYWIKGLSASEYISSLIEYTVITYIEDIFDYSDINRYIEIVGNQNLYLIESIIPDSISISELKALLASLIREKVSIKDIVYIFEKLNDIADEKNEEIDLLEDMRIALNRQISFSAANPKDNTIYAYELSDSSINMFNFENNTDKVVHIEHKKIEGFLNKLKNKVQDLPSEAGELILIAPSDIRYLLFMLCSKIIPNIKVISHEEIVPECRIKILETL